MHRVLKRGHQLLRDDEDDGQDGDSFSAKRPTPAGVHIETLRIDSPKFGAAAAIPIMPVLHRRCVLA